MINTTEFLDFVYVGAPRCGSTWLAAVLEEHPDVFIPHNKEIHFFNDRLVYPFEYKYPRGIDHYRQYFTGANPEVVIGELSPFYYYDPNAAQRIYSHFPNTKIIAFLRNPVDMLYSLYLLLRQRERREPTFEQEITKNPQWLDLGFYHRLLTPYFDWFAQERIHIRIYEKIFADEETSCRELFGFLGIRDDFRPKALGVRVNASTKDQPRFTRQLRGRFLRMLNTPPMVPVKELMHRMKVNRINYAGTDKANSTGNGNPLINPCTRGQLMEQFEPDIKRLESLLGENLGSWRECGIEATSRFTDNNEHG